MEPFSRNIFTCHMPWNLLTKFKKDFLAECLSPWIAMGRQDDSITDASTTLARVLNWRSSEECRKLNDCAIRLSSEDDKWLNFDNHCKKERVSFALCMPEVCIHLTGRYRGIPHIQIVSSYDTHFAIKEIAKYLIYTKHVDNIKNDQKNCIKLRLDSFRFLASNLDKLDGAEYIDYVEKLEELCLPSRVPAYYYTLPGFTWDAVLKHRVLRFELINIKICFRRFFSEIRGFIVKNWLYIYDSKYFDDVQNFDFTTIALDSSTGYILEVKSQHLHDAHIMVDAKVMIAKSNFHSRSVFSKNLVSVFSYLSCSKSTNIKWKIKVLERLANLFTSIVNFEQIVIMQSIVEYIDMLNQDDYSVKRFSRLINESRKRQKDVFSQMEFTEGYLKQNLGLSNSRMILKYLNGKLLLLLLKIDANSSILSQLLNYQITTKLLLKTLFLKAGPVKIIEVSSRLPKKELQSHLYLIIGDIMLNSNLNELHTEKIFESFVTILPSLLLKPMEREELIAKHESIIGKLYV
ncbi:hypothetical protein ALC53_11454 [Atta colombica]|uniref:Uncharacterized protein n=1 Tax=Atta colombica TaxID=520822 RepID=A0A151HZN2_9HYME|nr:hypothetical protein ALC53_11454 [Atta colombica]